MKKIFYLFLIVKIGFLSAQIDSKNLYQDWYAVKIEMKDGSKPFLKKPTYLFNHAFRIEKKAYFLGEVRNLGSNSRFAISYQLKNNELITSPGSSLLIEKLTADSLILSQKIENMEEMDLLKYHLIPFNKVLSDRAEIFKEKDTLIANPILGPSFRKNLSIRTIKNITSTNPYLKNPILDYRFNGFILIDLQNRKITITLKDSDPKFQAEIDKKIAPLKIFRNWDISSFENFKFLKIPFVFVHYYEKKPEVESFGDLYTFTTDNFDEVFITEKIGLSEIEKSNEYFNFAIREYQRKNLKEAINLFEKSFKTNAKNLNAYYNYAALQFSNGSKEKACEIYQFLIDEGQKPAVKEFNQKCVK
jgi:tetratricopeptide (TPR) repeat protein